MRISFLHTIGGNRQVFEHAANRIGLRSEELRHEVRPDLREAVEHAGEFTADLLTQTSLCLQQLAADSDAVIVTCATLGPAVAEMESSTVPIVRADAALAAAAAEVGGSIAVLCAAESAIEPTRRLFAQHASRTDASVKVIHVPQVWALFKSGDMDACLATVAASADDAYEAGASVVAFAHPWMAPAVKFASQGRQPLDSPHAALRAVMYRP